VIKKEISFVFPYQPLKPYNMRCIAIDDEPLALEIVKDFCTRIPWIDLVGTFTDPYEAVTLINSEPIDLIFLDIHMPDINGLELLKLLYKPPPVIFTTAFKEHAFQGFEYDAVDYLIKPFSFDRFSKAINKAIQLIKYKESQFRTNDDHIISGDFLMVKVEYSTVRLNLNDILYIEGLKDYVKIYTGAKPILTKTTLKNITDKLPSNRFLRVHKSFIIAINKITMIENSRIVIDGQRIPVGESFRTEFFDMVHQNTI
jgi:DNA-binding LytR/AlgR family response regulator